MLKSGFFQELESERVLRLRDVGADIGRAYLASIEADDAHQNKRHVYAVAGTYFRKAAANSLLLGEIRIAAEFFTTAAKCYRFAGMPYGIVMEALAGNHWGDLSWGDTIDSPQGVYALIASLSREIGLSNRLKELRQKMDEFRGDRLGVLAIPVDLFLDLFDTMQDVDREAKVPLTALREALLPFLEMYSRALRRAQRDEFHWKRLAMPFHPFEPDIVGLVLMVRDVAAKRDLSPKSLFEGIPVSREATAALEYCLSKTGRQPNKHTENDKV
jgi:hypothetical protein